MVIVLWFVNGWAALLFHFSVVAKIRAGCLRRMTRPGTVARRHAFDAFIVMRLRWIAFLLASFLLVSSVGAAAPPPPPLKLVSDVWVPFTDIEGKPREAIELVRVALTKGGVDSRISIMTWSEAYAGLEQGKFDGSAAVWKSAEREKFLLFSKPYLENRLVLVARKGERVSFGSVKELVGKRLAVTKGYAYGDAVLKVAKVTYVVRDSDEECLRAVLAKQADYVLLDELMVRHLFDFHENKANELIVAGTIPIVRYPLHFALRKDNPRASAIIADFDKNIERMRADGTYNIVLKVPWIRADVNGDGVPEYVGSKVTTHQGSADPSKTKSFYPVFVPENAVPNMQRSPGYVVDGKSYNNWGDAATTIQRTGPTKPQGVYKYSTGVVLMEF